MLFRRGFDKAVRSIGFVGVRGTRKPEQQSMPKMRGVLVYDTGLKSKLTHPPNVDFPDLHVKQVRGVLITDTDTRDVYSKASSTKGRFGALSSEESQNWAGLFVR